MTTAARPCANAAPSRTPRPGEALRHPCHLCGRDDLCVLPFRYLLDEQWLHGVVCRACGLVFVHPQPTPDRIAALYAEEYFTACSETCGAHGREAYMVRAEKAEREQRAKAHELDRRFVRWAPERGRLLEIGCGPGFLLARLRELGWEVRGLEISAFAAREALERFGLEVAVGPVEQAAWPAGSLDAVFLGDVLEHLAQPLTSLAAIRAWMRPGGVIGVAVPSTMNALSAQIGLRWYGLRGRSKTMRIPPYHLFEYTPRTLRAMLAKAGFDVLQVEQSAVPMTRMALRGSLLENAGKAALQLTAIASSRLCNRGGDRLLAIARRPAA